MCDLADRICTPCRKGAPSLSLEETARWLELLPGWQIQTVEGTPRLVRVYPTKNFQRALDFANRVGAAAEEENHHPALLVEWGRLTVSWWTHSISGLHMNDVILAARTDRLYGEELGPV